MPSFTRQAPAPPSTNTCPRHPDEPALINCGNCGRVFCTRCVSLEAEGMRCVDCRARKTSTVVADAPPKAVFTPIRHDPESGVAIYTCPRHPKEETRLTCGRCDQPICPRCMVYTSTGLRCPDCIYGKRKEGAATAGEMKRNFRAREADASRNMPLSQTDLLLGGLTAFVIATVFGGIWGYVIDWEFDGLGAYLNKSIHFLPEIVLALIISEAVLRVCNMRRSGNMALIAAAATLWGLIMPIVVFTVRYSDSADIGETAKAVGQVVIDYFRYMDIVGGISGIFGTGNLIFLADFNPVWWIMAVVLVILRLRK